LLLVVLHDVDLVVIVISLWVEITAVVRTFKSCLSSCLGETYIVMSSDL
jgi:hypothetical protein